MRNRPRFFLRQEAGRALLGAVLASSAVLTLAAVFGFSTQVQPQSATLTASADTYLRQGAPNQNQGAATFLLTQQSGQNRALVRIEQSEIAAHVGDGALVSATLELYIEHNANNWGSTGRTVDVHRLTANWTELGATWNCGIDANTANAQPDCSPQWNGGTFEAEATDSVLHTNGLTGWVQFDVTVDVEAFLTGAPNYGWLIKKNDEGQSGQVEYTSRQGTVGQEPRLTLVVESAAADAVPPRLQITAPSESLLVNEQTPEIGIAYSDGGSGVDVASLQVAVDTTDITATCAVEPAVATCQAPPLSEGVHTVTVELRDLAGNLAIETLSFELLLGAGLLRVFPPRRICRPRLPGTEQTLMAVSCKGNNLSG